MDEEKHVIFAINVAQIAVTVLWRLLLVSNHSLLRGEMLEAAFISALDLHLEKNRMQMIRVRG